MTHLQSNFKRDYNAEMLSVAAPSYSDPSRYELVKLPRPTISEPTDVLIQVHAASINPVDVKLAAGLFKYVLTDEYDLPLFALCESILSAFEGFHIRSGMIVQAW